MSRFTLGLAVFVFSFSLLGPLLAYSAPPAAARAEARSFELGINRLATQSYASHKPCVAYRAQLSKLDKTSRAVFKSKADALAAMKVLARYPGIPASASKAYTEAMGTLPPEIDWSWFTATYGSIQGACGILESFTGMSQLINTTRVIAFSPAQKAQIRSTALAFLSKNSKQPGTLIVALVQASLLDNMVGARLVKLDSKSAQQLKGLIQQGEKARSDLAARVKSRGKTATARDHASDLIYELKSANGLRTRFLPLLGKIRT